MACADASPSLRSHPGCTGGARGEPSSAEAPLQQLGSLAREFVRGFRPSCDRQEDSFAEPSRLRAPPVRPVDVGCDHAGSLQRAPDVFVGGSGCRPRTLRLCDSPSTRSGGELPELLHERAGRRLLVLGQDDRVDPAEREVASRHAADDLARAEALVAEDVCARDAFGRREPLRCVAGGRGACTEQHRAEHRGDQPWTGCPACTSGSGSSSPGRSATGCPGSCTARSGG